MKKSLLWILISGLLALGGSLVYSLKKTLDHAYSQDIEDTLSYAESLASSSKEDQTSSQPSQSDSEDEQKQKQPENSEDAQTPPKSDSSSEKKPEQPQTAADSYVQLVEQKGISRSNLTLDDRTWVYRIQPGDTLSQLSGSLLWSVQELAQYNEIENPDLIYSGSSLRIPQKEAE